MILDVITANSVYKHFFSTEWYRLFISHQTYSLYLIYHPEFAFYWQNSNGLFSNELAYESSKFYVTIYDYVNLESWVNPVLSFIDMLILIYFISLIIVFYFSYYSSATKENSTVDSDYLST